MHLNPESRPANQTSNPDQAPKRRGRKPGTAKGLPDKAALVDLAETYLQTQCSLYPAAVVNWLLGGLRTAEQLADDFERRFLLGQQPDANNLGQIPKGYELGAAYQRYSCDHSNPRSLAQQLRNALQAAARDGVLIPWMFVFADAAVTGTIAARRGYQMARWLVSQGGPARVLYVDDISRASRDSLEILKLGRIADRNGVRLRGATDGFDSQLPQAKMQLAVHAMVHEQSVDHLKHRVERGMSDAFEQGRVIQPPALGYELRPQLDTDGQVLLSHKKVVVHERVINELDAEVVRSIFELLVNNNWSPGQIGKHFNDIGAAGRKTWDSTSIRQVLTRELYVGVEHFGKTRAHKDEDTGRVTIVRLPRDKWKTRLVPDLRIISDDLWKRAQDRLAQISLAYAPKGKGGIARSSMYSKLLFRPVCGYCGSDLILGRSGKYASLGCPIGRDRKHDCQLTSYKSVSIIDSSLLEFLKREVLVSKFLRKVVRSANHFLKAASKRVPADSGPLKEQLELVKTKERRLLKLLDSATDEDMETFEKAAKECGRQKALLQTSIRDAESASSPPPPPLKLKDVEQLAADLLELLVKDVAVAAPILAKLTGPIRVLQGQRKAGRKNGAPWLASFTLNGAAVLLDLASRRNCPTTSTLEYLNNHGWTMPQPVEIALEPMTAAAYFALQAVELAKAGHNIPTIAEMVGTSTKTIRGILRSAKADGTSVIEAANSSGRLPTWWAGKRGPKVKNQPKYIEHAPEIARLYDQENLSFELIGAKLQMSPMTATKAYDELLAGSFCLPSSCPREQDIDREGPEAA